MVLFSEIAFLRKLNLVPTNLFLYDPHRSLKSVTAFVDVLAIFILNVFHVSHRGTVTVFVAIPVELADLQHVCST